MNTSRYSVKWATGLVFVEKKSIGNWAEDTTYPFVPAHEDILTGKKPATGDVRAARGTQPTIATDFYFFIGVLAVTHDPLAAIELERIFATGEGHPQTRGCSFFLVVGQPICRHSGFFSTLRGTELLTIGLNYLPRFDCFVAIAAKILLQDGVVTGIPCDVQVIALFCPGTA